MYREWDVISIPHCIENVRNLKVFVLDFLIYLEDVPLSIFNLPKLKICSLYLSSLSYDSFLGHNVPSNISLNDTESVNEWMEMHFVHLDMDDTEYWLSDSLICDEDNSSFPSQFADFVEIACQYPIDFKADNVLCPPWRLGMFPFKL